jgi:hypothetical protein
LRTVGDDSHISEVVLSETLVGLSFDENLSFIGGLLVNDESFSFDDLPGD